MALPATDVFTGTNGTQLTTYSANWTLNASDFDIQTNSLAADTPGGECLAHWSADAFANNQYAQATYVVTGTADAAIGVGVRIAGSGFNTGYIYYSYRQNTVGERYIFCYVSGGYTQLGSTGVAHANNDVMRLEANGTLITPKINGVLDATVGETTDSTITSGSAGVSGYSDSAVNRIDGWEGGNLGVAAKLHMPFVSKKVFQPIKRASLR